MTAKERILKIRLSDSIRHHPEYAKAVGISLERSKRKLNGNSQSKKECKKGGT